MKKALLLIVAILGWAAYAHSEKRLALVIGNSEYGKSNYLENPVHDAEDVSSKLTMLGFEVIKLTDASLREMHETISDFGIKSKGYDMVLFYYSGHGLQTKGENYLMPIDAELKSEADVRYMCLPLNLILDKLDESNCQMKIVVLDACRNNPFSKRWYRGDKSQGLASVSPPKGTYITFSTAAGSVALDGIGRNSPYTKAFLETLDMPGLSLFDFFNEVGQKVMAETNNEQDPWTNHNTMKGKFFFNLSSPTKTYNHIRKISSYPSWIVTKKKDEYLGVSIPMDDKDNARKLAVLNALLQYIFCEGEVETSFSGEVKMKNLQTKIVNDIVISEEKSSFDAMGLLLGFDIEIMNEYYNDNHEFFVLCSFKRNTTGQNGIQIKRKLQVDELGQAVYVSLSVDAFILDERMKMEYDFSKSIFTNGCHRLLLDSIDMALLAVDYRNCTFGPDSINYSCPLLNISECGSLGLAELAFMAQLPLVTDSIEVNTMSKMEEANGSYSINTTSHFLGTSISKAIRASIDGVTNNFLCISIKDPYDTVPLELTVKNTPPTDDLITTENGLPSVFINLLYTDSVNVNYTICNGEPLLLKKTMGMFDVLCLNCLKKAETSSTMSFNGDNNWVESMSKSTETISCYYPFFFLDRNHSNLKHRQNVSKIVAILSD